MNQTGMTPGDWIAIVGIVVVFASSLAGAAGWFLNRVSSSISALWRSLDTFKTEMPNVYARRDDLIALGEEIKQELRTLQYRLEEHAKESINNRLEEMRQRRATDWGGREFLREERQRAIEEQTFTKRIEPEKTEGAE